MLDLENMSLMGMAKLMGEVVEEITGSNPTMLSETSFLIKVDSYIFLGQLTGAMTLKPAVYKEDVCYVHLYTNNPELPIIILVGGKEVPMRFFIRMQKGSDIPIPQSKFAFFRKPDL